MVILFPSNPLQPKSVDSSFGYEARAAKSAGFNIGRISLEVLLGGEVNVSGCEPERGAVLYRGWLMKIPDYVRMQRALPSPLLQDVTIYQTAYELPLWYKYLVDVTPRTIVLPKGVESYNLDDVAKQVAEAFGPNPVLVKDYIKSAKHRWYDACFIQDASDAEDVKRITRNFLTIQAENLWGGLCFRKYETFQSIGVHSKTWQPLVNEWRYFLHNGRTFYRAPYWTEGAYRPEGEPNDRAVEEMVQPLAWMPFLSLDVAQHESGSWSIVEVNPFEATGVPEGGDVNDFYLALASTLKLGG